MIDGSPLIALKAGPPTFTRLFWVEADSRNVASLEAHREEYPARQISVYAGDANERVDDILQALPARYPTFAFLDPRGGELNWQTIVKLARHKSAGEKKIELFILFAYNQGIVRLMPLDPSRMRRENEAVLDRVMPDADGWRALYRGRTAGSLDRHEVRRAMLDEYVRGLKALSYVFVPAPRLIRTPNGHPLYFMIFASDHQAGDKIMSWCLTNVRDSRVQQSFLSYDEQY